MSLEGQASEKKRTKENKWVLIVPEIHFLVLLIFFIGLPVCFHASFDVFLVV